MKKSEFIKRCNNFFAKWIYRKDDFDGAYENQCVDTAKRFFFEVCDIKNPPATGTGWADGYWKNRTKIPAIYKNFDFVTDKTKLEVGDVVITNNPHVAIYASKDRLFGQNHGGHLEANDYIGFNVFSRNFLGALRFKYEADNGQSYFVKITCDLPLRVRKYATVNSTIITHVYKNEVYTIVSESTDENGMKWGELISGAGWIALDYTRRL